jgi:hypothetical protein
VISQEFKKYLNLWKIELLQRLQNVAPVRSGTLKKSIRLEEKQDGGFRIKIPVYYAIYTEDPWDKNFTKDGRENPNLYWIKEQLEIMLIKMERDLNGRIKRFGSEDTNSIK